MNKKPSSLLLVLAFSIVYILWGTTYVAILIGLETLPPFILAAIRFGVAGITVFIIALVKGERINIQDKIKNLWLGIIILTGGQGFLFWAEQFIPSGYAAIIVSTLPIWYVILDRKNWNVYFNNKLILAGIVLGFAGILLLFEKYLGPSNGTTTMQLFGMFAVLAGCICWAVGTLLYKNHVDQHAIFQNIGWQLIGGVLSSLAIALASGEFNNFAFSEVSLHSWLATVYLALVGSVIAFIAFNWLLTVRPPAIVGTYAYVNPVIALLLGWLIADENISLSQVAGMIVILFSAFLVNSPRYREIYKKRFSKIEMK